MGRFRPVVTVRKLCSWATCYACWAGRVRPRAVIYYSSGGLDECLYEQAVRPVLPFYNLSAHRTAWNVRGECFDPIGTW